mgnify:CR=1 FL=1
MTALTERNQIIGLLEEAMTMAQQIAENAPLAV